MQNLTEVSLAEAVRLGAADGSFYAAYFFPRTVRQAPADFDREVWDALDNPDWRYIAMKIFRGGAKTARLRLFASRRIAYGVSRSIVYTSNSEAHAVRSVSWLKRQVSYNRIWAETFRLRQGAKWSETEIEIIHDVEEIPIKVVAVGITGQVRGFLSDDDFRPDLIVGDDVDNEETTATREQQLKAQNLFFGALGKSLAPPSEAPLSKMVLAQTPLAIGDTIDVCSQDPSWHTLTFGCFNADGKSTWEVRFPTTFLLQEKQNHIRRNHLSQWLREMECKIVSTEEAAFRMSWLKEFEVLPEGCWFGIAIDPAFSDPIKASANDNDYMAIVLLAFHGRKVFLVDYVLIRGRELDFAVAELFRLIYKGRPRYIAVETIAFQKILASLLQAKMHAQKLYIPIREVTDRRRKSDRIMQDIGDVASSGNLYWRGQGAQPEFATQFALYHPAYRGHDDLLDAIAMGIKSHAFYLSEGDGDTYEGEYEELREAERHIPALSDYRGAP